MSSRHVRALVAGAALAVPCGAPAQTFGHTLDSRLTAMAVVAPPNELVFLHSVGRAGGGDLHVSLPDAADDERAGHARPGAPHPSEQRPHDGMTGASCSSPPTTGGNRLGPRSALCATTTLPEPPTPALVLLGLVGLGLAVTVRRNG